MRRGINHMPLPTTAPLERGAPDIIPLDTHRAQILGIPIEFHQHTKFPTADARGFFWKQKIVVGPSWMHLDPRTQRAALLHEARHLQRYHREQRIILSALLALPSLILIPWRILAAIAVTWLLYFAIEQLFRRHELDADRFAAEHGYGRDLLALVKRIGPPPTLPTFYPDYEKRCDALERAIKEKDDAASA